MSDYLLKVIFLLSMVSSVYAETLPNCGMSYGIIPKTILNPKLHYFQTTSFPWIVLIRKTYVNHNSHFCKGFLIHPHAVLTAAHCVQNESEENLIVYTKPVKMFSRAKILKRNVSEIFINPSYQACDVSWNHAILRLDKSFPLSPKLNVICLPTFDRLSYEGNCGYTFININNEDLLYTPGKPNSCRVLDILRHDPIPYMRSSCELGKNNTDLISGISAQLESCEMPTGSHQFYYFGMNIDILYNCNNRQVIMNKNDDLYNNLIWITKILRDHF